MAYLKFKRHKWSGDTCARCAMMRRRELTMGRTFAWAYRDPYDLRWRSRSGACVVKGVEP